MSAAKRKRRRFSEEFNVAVVEQVLRGSSSVAELAQEHKIRPSVLHRWRNEVLAQLRGHAAERAAMAALRAQERKHRIIQAENQKLKAELVFFATTFSSKGQLNAEK